ncbi:hypothetical protein KCU64_g4502, partial [Aureobasidium melanogenum]
MESSSGLPITTDEAPHLAPGTQRINFLDPPSEVKNLVYFYLYRDRTKRAINLCVLGPAWKTNAQPLAEVFKWLKKVGDQSSAQFRRLHVIHEQAPTFQCEIFISITDEKQVTIEEIKGPAKYLAWLLERDRQQPRAFRMPPEHKDIYSRLNRELTDDLVGGLTQRINTNETGALGVTEFEIILERIGFHLSEFKKCWQKEMVQSEAERRRRQCRTRRRR